MSSTPPPENSTATEPPGPENFAWADVASAEPSLDVLDYARRYYEAAAAFEGAGRTDDAARAKRLGDAGSFTLRLDSRPPL